LSILVTGGLPVFGEVIVQAEQAQVPVLADPGEEQ
jgi:predicted transcriptional regulator